MKKNKVEKVVGRLINIEVSNNKDKELLTDALLLLDKIGYVIVKKNDLVLESD